MFTENSFESRNPEGVHTLVYSEFAGDPTRTVVCVHGLSRNGRDFDWLAEKLAADGHRVICPDMAGRGRSKPFANSAFYNYAQYVADCTTLLTHLNVEKVDWVGTSMGGLIGMMLAAQPSPPIQRMVLNDIGPFVPKEAALDIKNYVGKNPAFDTWDDYFNAFKNRMASFGLDAEQEDYLARTSLETTAEGKFRLAYDTNIIAGLQSTPEITDTDLWHVWEHVMVPTLVLRGANSTILSAETLQKMKTGKNLQAITCPDVGHAPALMSEAQIQPIRDFLA